MLITLWARAAETRRPDAISRDEKAVEIIEQLDYDFDRFARGWKSQVGVAVRDRCIDRLVHQFIASHPDPVIINVGAGLDARCLRFEDQPGLLWYDLDLPDAIALRRRFIDETDRRAFIESSALDGAWMERIRAETGERPALLIAEGVLMFFERKQVSEMLNRLAATFAGASGLELVFDLIGPLMVRVPFLHDTLPRTAARFRWGARSMTGIATWSDRFELRAARSMLDECPARWLWMKWCRLVPALRRQFFVMHLARRQSMGPRK